MKRIATALLLTLFVCSSFVAADDDAGRESPFSVGVGARALGMGGGFTSIANDATTVFYNPAGLPYLQSQEFSFMYMRLFEETTFNYGVWALPTLDYGGLGISYARIGTENLLRRTDFLDGGKFDFAESQFQLAYGREIISNLALGASLKVIRQNIDTYVDNGIGSDIGLFAHVYRNLNFSAVVRNVVQAQLRLKGNDEKLPVTAIAGFGLREFKLAPGVMFAAALEAEKWEDRSLKFHGGGEVLIDGMYALRAGYDRDNLAFGGGLKFKRLAIDYAYKLMDDIEDSHRISLTIDVGTTIADQQHRRELKRQQEGSRLIAGDRKKQFEFFRARAEEHYDNFNLDSALQNYERALAYDPDNQEIIGTISSIKEALETKRTRDEQMQETIRTREISVASLLGQAETLYGQVQYGAALDALQQVDSLDSGNPDAHALREKIDDAVRNEITAALITAQQAAASGNLLAEIEAYGKVLSFDPTNTAAKDARDKAVQRLTKSQALDMALDFYRVGRYEEARARFKRVLELDAGHPVAVDYINKIDRALAKPPTLEELQQDKDVWPLYLEGLRFMRERQYQKAIEMWEKVLEKYPNNHNTLDNIEQARLRMQSEEGK